jgi:hypothetical protein
MELEIRNSDLTADAIPDDPADPRFEAFALSFDGYAHWGDRCGPRAQAAAAAFRERGILPSTVSDLRACLFYEQQRWRWTDHQPDDHAVAYLQALLDALREAARL